MKFASLFSGGGGSDLGAIAAGLTHAWGLEYDPRIADVYRQNIGECHVLDILEANPHDFEPVDWLHASPVCKAFSSANAKAGEKQWDIDCGNKIAQFVEVLQPKYFSLENVQAYGKSKAFQQIVNGLHSLGYWTQWEILNAADFGVAQSRKRLILRAIKGEIPKPYPSPLPHVGWYEAIKDLVHDLPDSQLAEWQIKALPFDYSLWRLGATLVENTGARSDRPLQTRKANEPSWTIRALTDTGHWHRATALERGRVVQLDIKCLARLQSFPDWYQFPERKSLAGTIIGNSVPPLLMKGIIEATI